MSSTGDETEVYPTDLEAWATLPSGRRLHIRPLRHGEEQTVRDLYTHLSDRARYQRFLFVTRELPEPVLRLLVGVDHRSARTRRRGFVRSRRCGRRSEQLLVT